MSAPHRLSAEAGRAVLQDGGNAAEAAIAMAANLAVVYPHMTGIGGDGFWLIHRPGKPVAAIDASGRAGEAVTPALFSDRSAIPWRGRLAAITVAGTVSGWDAALSLLPGELTRERLLRDAVIHAENGVPVSQGGAAIAKTKGPELGAQPGAYKSIFEPQGKPLCQGDVLRQPRLAQTLSQLAEQGFDAFYRGELAQTIARDLEQLGSPLRGSDLAAHTAEHVTPLYTEITGARLYNLPFPTQGLASLVILKLFDTLAPDAADSFAHVHLLVEASKQAFRVRDASIGDRAASDLDAQGLLRNAAALETMRKAIDPEAAAPWPHPAAPGDTTWFGAADRFGNVVSAIQSTYFEFGSGLVLPETGITWQNRGAGFNLVPGHPNMLAPRKRPFTTLNPALSQFADGRVLAYGTMGGEGQPQTQAALFSRYHVYGQKLTEAIAAPRWLLGRTWGEETTRLRIEEGFAPEVYIALEKAGHEIARVALHDPVMGHAGAVLRRNCGTMEGASDPRSDGAALAW